MGLIVYKNVKDNRIRKLFEEVLEKYPALEAHRVILEQRKLGKTTMRAQPKMMAYFTGDEHRTFFVQFNNSTELDDKISIHKVPDMVLKGWFAHEIGHVLDYLERGFLEMVVFGIRYLTSRRYRKKVEHKADEIAIDHGLSEEILATKRYILEHTSLPEKYKRRIRKYYMSVDDVHELVEKDLFEEVQPDDANIFDPKP